MSGNADFNFLTFKNEVIPQDPGFVETRIPAGLLLHGDMRFLCKIPL